jgi:hypothetical protein
MIKTFLLSIALLTSFASSSLAQDANGRNWLIYCESGAVDAIDVNKCNSLLNSYYSAMNTYNNAKLDAMTPPNFETGALGQAIDDYNYYEREARNAQQELDLYEDSLEYYQYYQDYYYYE